MGYPNFSVIYSGLELNRDISESIKVASEQGLKTRVGTASMEMENINNKFTSTYAGSSLMFHVDDQVNIFFGYGYKGQGSTAGSSLVFPGFVNEIVQNSNKDKQSIKISLVNKLERMLSMMDAKDYPAGGAYTTASQILTDVITRVNGYRKSGEPAIGTGQITATTFDVTSGGGYAYVYKPVVDILKDLSAKEKTGNGQFIYYIDNSNNLVYKPRPGTTGTTPVLHEYQFTDTKATYGVFDVVNAIIVNCGKDNNNKSILAMGVNYASVTDIGFRWKYYVRSDIAAGYKNYDTTTQRNMARAEGQKWAAQTTALLGNARWKVTLTAKGTVNYPGTSTMMVQGEVVSLTSPSNWNGTKILRVQNIGQAFHNKGWVTTIELEEDDLTIVEAH